MWNLIIFWWQKSLRLKIHEFLVIRGQGSIVQREIIDTAWCAIASFMMILVSISWRYSKFSCYLSPQEKTYLRPTSNSKASTTYTSNDDRSFAKPATITAPPPQPQQQQQLQAALTAAVAAATATITTSQGQSSMSLSSIQFNHWALLPSLEEPFYQLEIFRNSQLEIAFLHTCCWVFLFYEKRDIFNFVGQ